MTLQHEADYPIPEGTQPAMERALQLILRELDQVLIPELQSERARTTAGMLGQLLRQLIVRETRLPSLLAEWGRKQEELLCELDPAFLNKPTGSPLEQQRRMTAAITRLTATRAGVKDQHSQSGITDAWTCRALAVEREYYAARLQMEQELPTLQRSAQRAQELDLTAERLESYLRAKLKGDIHVVQVRKLLGGFSKETFIVDAQDNGEAWPIVLRRDVALGAVAGSVVDEAPVLKAVHAAGLPVPDIVLTETDRSIFGEAFTIARKVPGEVAFSNVHGLQMGGGQENAARGLAQVLGQLHSLAPEKLKLPAQFFDPKASMADCVLRQIEHYESAWRTRIHQPSPTVSAAFAWLRAHVPRSSAPARIVHGDAGLHNLMMCDGRVSALLDWELARMGDPIEDLAYCRLWVDQALPWDEFLAIYYRHGGQEYRPEFETFYGVLANLRIVIFAAQAGYGTYWTDHPEPTLTFATSHFHALFIEKVAQQLISASGKSAQ